MTLFKLVAFSSEEKGADFSEQIVADAFRRSSVLIETPDMYMYKEGTSYIFGFAFP